MIEPYSMVAVNAISCLLLIFFLLFYRFIFPRKPLPFLIAVLLISILPLTSLLRPGDYESGDFNIHIYRIMSFYDSLAEGHLFPSWAAELNATYGNPLFIFNYSLPYYGVSFLHFLGLSFIASMKVYLGLTVLLSGFSMYIWIKKLTNNSLAAFTASVFYIFNPYHLIDVHFRATLGESTIFAFAPFVFFFITKYFKEKQFGSLIFISLFTGILFLAHPLLGSIFFAINIFYSIMMNYQTKRKKLLYLCIVALVIGAVASAYSWISFLIYASYTFPNPNPVLSFNPLHQLFYSPWRYGFLFQGPNGELALMIGYTQTLVVIATVFVLIRSTISKKAWLNHVFWLCIFFALLFSMHQFSKHIWNFFPIFWMLIPTGRLLLPTALATSVLAGLLALLLQSTQAKRRLLYLLLIVTVGSTILNWGHRRVIPEINDNILRQRVWESTVTEGVTAYFLNNKWANINNFWFSEQPKKHIEILQGKAVVEEITRNSVHHTYVIDAKTPLLVKENTLYFPGWTLKSNDKNVQIYPGNRGVIHARLPQGLQYVELSYDDIPVYKLAKMVSIGLFSTLLIHIIFQILKQSLQKR